jgi:hypothetical protein
MLIRLNGRAGCSDHQDPAMTVHLSRMHASRRISEQRRRQWTRPIRRRRLPVHPENVAVFGDFRYRSNSLGKVVSSPLSILVKVVDGKEVVHE